MKASEYFPSYICKALWKILSIPPDEIEVSPGSQPHLYYKKILLGYFASPFLFINNPDYEPRKEREGYPKHRQWHPVFDLAHLDVMCSCACKGPQCVKDIETWRPPILKRLEESR